MPTLKQCYHRIVGRREGRACGAMPHLTVRHLRQALAVAAAADAGVAAHAPRGPWQVLRDLGDASPWREAVDEYTGDATASTSATTTSSSRFLPYVQRFLYGEGAPRAAGGDAAPARRCACSAAATSRRCASCRAPGDAPLSSRSCTSTCTSSSTSTSCMLDVEVGADDLRWPRRRSCCTASAAPIPAGWDATARRCTAWPASNGCRGRQVLARSDAQQREPSSATWPSTARRASPRTGPTCSQPLVQRPFRRRRARCAIARSSTTACR